MIYPDELKLTKNLVFDTHAHYDDLAFNGVREQLLDMLCKNGVYRIITCGTDIASSLKSLQLAEKYDFIYAAVGIHPENLSGDMQTETLRRLSSHKKCVAIGEIGLDYHYTQNNSQEQKEIFEKQIILAKECNLPVIVHDRDAHADTFEILRRHKPRGVLHCFSGSAEMAKEAVSFGMYIGVGGVVTFKNAKRLPEVITEVPLDKLLLETDCPYLCPEPYRGQLCHSGFITLTANKISEILGIPRDALLESTLKNARKLFGI